MVYYCKRCNYNTARKGNLIRHLLKKNPCMITNEAVTREECIQELYIRKTVNLQKNTENSQKNTENSQKNTENSINNRKTHICKFCNKGFTRKDTMKFHIKKY